MIVGVELGLLEDWEFWSGAKTNMDEWMEDYPEFIDYLREYIEEIFTDGCTETELNDFIWFDAPSIFEDWKEEYREVTDDNI